MINIRMQPAEVKKLSPNIKVVGVGGAGGNAVNNMISTSLEGVEFLVCNTDAQALEGSLCERRIQLGGGVTGGLGAGAKPEVGRAAAEESLEEVIQYLEGANMAFITAGMGGGTGTGAAPVIARVARERGILTVGVVTKPFHFEGTHRMKQAEAGIEQMQEYVDTLIVIPNQNLFRIANEKTTFAEAFKMADSVLQSGVRGVTDLMVMPGLINLDFADIRSAMQEMGKAMMGTGEAEGDKRAIEAAEAAINNPLLDDVSMKGARGVIINVTGGYDMTLFEADEACNRIREEVDPSANIIFGATFDEAMDGMMRVSVVATGIDAAEQRKAGGGNGGRILERAQPVTPTIPQPDRAAESLPQQQVVPVASYKPASQSIPSRPVAQATQQPVASAQATARKLEEPEADMFEQQEFASQQTPEVSPVSPQNTVLRGTTHEGAFIPPRPVTAQEMGRGGASGFGPSFGSFHQQQSQAARPAAPVEAPVQTGMSPVGLRPPVPGAGAAERRRTPSLFERITGQGGRRDDEEANRPASASSEEVSLRAPQRPSQGRLPIDGPARPAPSSDGDLDIPAFLRRQAN
ncbi:MAG: cell division protein FtsZ [Alphaproteobacteria bacterium]|nr:cell division protein FtsZ [Alphaproteobacteria bacterium]